VFYQKDLHTVQEMKIVICSKNGYVAVAYVTGILCFFFLLCGHGKFMRLKDVTVNTVWFK